MRARARFRREAAAYETLAGLGPLRLIENNADSWFRRVVGWVRARFGRSKTSTVLDAVATSAPETSVTVPSVKATREPDLTTVPVAVSSPLDC